MARTNGIDRFKELFHGAYYSCEIGLRKPDAAAFHHVLALHDAEPSRTLFIDDSEQHGPIDCDRCAAGDNVARAATRSAESAAGSERFDCVDNNQCSDDNCINEYGFYRTAIVIIIIIVVVGEKARCTAASAGEWRIACGAS